MVQRQLTESQKIIQNELDKNKEKNRAHHKFRQSIKTPTTLRAYNHALDKFMVQSNLYNYDDAIKLKLDKIQDLLEDFIISLKNYSFQTANQYLAGVELFFDMNMVLYHKKILRKLLPGNDKEQGGKLPYTTEEIQKMLAGTTKFRTKAIIHYLASTGSRPAGIEDPVLMLKHIEDMPNNCKSVYIYDGSKQSYYAFLTPEASKALDDYLNARKRNGEHLTSETPVFANMEGFPTTQQRHLSANSARQMIRDTINKAGIDRTKKGKRYDKATIYGLRKRWNTIMKSNKDINPSLIELMLGHSLTIKLDESYLKPATERLFEEYKKGIKELTVFNDTM